MTNYSYIYRDSDSKFSDLLSSQEQNRDVILIQGARQVGKTTLVRHNLQNHDHMWIDFQNDRSLRVKIDATQSFEEFTDLLALEIKFKPGTGKILVIDEAQESIQLGAYVRYMKEIWPNQTVILLGSMMHRLFRKDIKYPVGRVKRFTIYPFSFLEFLNALDQDTLYQKIKKWSVAKPFNKTLHLKSLELLDQYLKVGGLPQVVIDYKTGADWQDRLIELSYDYIEDYKRIEGESQSNLFELALKRTAETLGNPSRISSFVATNQPGYACMPDILNLLENWLMIHKITIETPSPTGGRKIPPKRYLFDHGIRQRFSPLLSQLQNLLSKNASQRTPLGGIIENYVLNECLAAGWTDIKSWREKVNGSEVDFMLRSPSALLPIEVKASLKTNRKFFSSLARCMKVFDLKQGFLINADLGQRYQEAEIMIDQIPLYAVGSRFKQF